MKVVKTIYYTNIDFRFHFRCEKGGGFITQNTFKAGLDLFVRSNE